jgi:hypothetical protein
MPTAALQSYFWPDQGAPAAGPRLTAMSRILGPPTLAIILLLLLPGVLL